MPDDNLENPVQKIICTGKPDSRKSIVIGAGGQGINAVISAMSRIEKTVPAAGLNNISWVGIDTSDIINNCRLNPGLYRLPDDRTHHGGAGVLYLYSPVPDGLSSDSLKDMLVNDPCFDWLPDSDLYDVETFTGAGSFDSRVAARLAFFNNEDLISRALINERDRLCGLSQLHENSNPGDDKEDGIVSVYLVVSIAGGAGSGMVADLAALARDIFTDHQPEIYGILLLNPADGINACSGKPGAEAYAALKEIDYFMSGGGFTAQYPSGRKVNAAGSLFDDGRLYLLDVQNMAGSSVHNPGQGEGMAGEFIAALLSSAGGDEVFRKARGEMPGDSVYLSGIGGSMRKACYNSFGISRAVCPVHELKEIGYMVTAVKVIDAFFKPVSGRLMSSTLGSIDSGLTGALRLDCRMIFERMNPDSKSDIAEALTSYREKLSAAAMSNDEQEIMKLMEIIISGHGRPELELKKFSMTAMTEKRCRPELVKIKGILESEILKYTTDTARGFNFAATAVDLLLDKTGLYQERYSRERAALEWYSLDDMKKILADAAAVESSVLKTAESLIEMASFNYAQLVSETMLASAESFTGELRAVLFSIKNRLINPLSGKLLKLRNDLAREIETSRFNLLEDKTPAAISLINSSDIETFIEKYFNSRCSVEELCSEIDFIRFYNETGSSRLTETDIISAEDSASSPGHVDSFQTEINNIRKNLFQYLYSKFEDSGFETIFIGEMLDEKKSDVNLLHEKLDRYSIPCICLNNSGRESTVKYRVVSDVRLNNEDGEDEPAAAQFFQAADLCGPCGIVSIGILAGFPLFKINLLHEYARGYHAIMSGKDYPLHLFNHQFFNAKYFPDPLCNGDYLDPAGLWSGLVLLKVLEEKDGVYSYADNISGVLKEMEARENYKHVVQELKKKIEQQGGIDAAPPEFLGEVISGLGILAKNADDGRLQFRREYSRAVIDLLDFNEAEKTASFRGKSREEFNGKNIPAPKFDSSSELVLFLEDNRRVYNYIIDTVKSVIERSTENITAGADISLPSWKIEQTALPRFKDKSEFYDYFEKRGSLEWQNFLIIILSAKLNEYILSSKFRLENNPALIDRTKAAEFLKSLELKMPVTVLRDVAMRNGIAE